MLLVPGTWGDQNVREDARSSSGERDSQPTVGRVQALRGRRQLSSVHRWEGTRQNGHGSCALTPNFRYSVQIFHPK